MKIKSFNNSTPWVRRKTSVEGDLSQNLTLVTVDELEKVLRESVSKSNSEYSR